MKKLYILSKEVIANMLSSEYVFDAHNMTTDFYIDDSMYDEYMDIHKRWLIMQAEIEIMIAKKRLEKVKEI
jgi:hypothetical protein